MGSAVSVSDMGRLPEIIEREKFYELTGYNEYALMATTATAKTSLTQTALSGKQIVYASKLNNKYVYFLTSIPSFSFDFLLNLETNHSILDKWRSLVSRLTIALPIVMERCRKRDFWTWFHRVTVFLAMIGVSTRVVGILMREFKELQTT